jgi:hypothetical protein
MGGAFGNNTVMHKHYTSLVLFLVLSSCTEKEIITLRIEPDRIILQGKHIDKTELEKELELMIEQKMEHGLRKSDLRIHVSADGNTPTSEMSKIERAIRRTGVSGDYIWTN